MRTGENARVAASIAATAARRYNRAAANICQEGAQALLQAEEQLEAALESAAAQGNIGLVWILDRIDKIFVGAIMVEV